MKLPPRRRIGVDRTAMPLSRAPRDQRRTTTRIRVRVGTLELIFDRSREDTLLLVSLYVLALDLGVVLNNIAVAVDDVALPRHLPLTKHSFIGGTQF